MTRRQRSSRPKSVHPTYEKILGQAVEALVEDGFDRFSVQRVLDGAGVSRATLYNHYGDVDSLIEAALVAVYATEGSVHRENFEALLAQSTDRASFRAALHKFLRNFGRIPADVRMRRAHTIALAATRPSLAEAITNVQDQITAKWLETLEEAQRRGFLRADLDMETVAVMAQAIPLGRIVDDAASSQVGDDRWTNMFIQIADRSFLEPDE